MFTQLAGRKLWYDGSITVEPENLMKKLELGQSIRGMFVERMTPEIERFNRLVRKEDRIIVEADHQVQHNFDWNIPDKYLVMNVVEYILQKFYALARIEKLTVDEIGVRLDRVEEELTLFIDFNLLSVLLLMVYIIDTLKEKNVVWGVGRGSSVSSYVLYILEVHDIDSVKFELDIGDFLKPDKYKQTHQMEE